MKVTDHTLGVIFGIIRGIVVMGIVYWVMLWYYSDAPRLPRWIADARTRPIMQLTAVKLDKWFVPGPDNKLLARDIAGTREADEILRNLINPAVADEKAPPRDDAPTAPAAPAAPQPKAEETGYKSSERTALENQLLQIETAARMVEARESATAQQD